MDHTSPQQTNVKKGNTIQEDGVQHSPACYSYNQTSKNLLIEKDFVSEQPKHQKRNPTQCLYNATDHINYTKH